MDATWIKIEVSSHISRITFTAMTAHHCVSQLCHHKLAITTCLLQILPSPFLSPLSLIHLINVCLSSSHSVSPGFFSQHTHIHISCYTPVTHRFAHMHLIWTEMPPLHTHTHHTHTHSLQHLVMLIHVHYFV